MPEQNDIVAAELNATHLGHRICIKRAEHSEVLVGQLVAVDHRPVNGRPGSR